MSFTPKTLSQRDPLWANEKLGFDDAVTIGTDGCALTCLTMLANGYGFSETPSSMNRKLKELGSGIGFLGSLIVWPGITRAFPQIIFQHINVCRDQPAPMNDINISLDAGQPLMVEIDHSPAPGLKNHWVVLYARQGDDYLMLDPWPLPPEISPTSLETRYGSGYPLSDLITTVTWYAASSNPVQDLSPSPAPGTGLFVRVQAAVTAGLRLRSGLATSANSIAVETTGTLLLCLEPESVALSKIGVINQWLQVRDADGLEGYVAAWYVEQVGAPESIPNPVPAPAPTPLPSFTSNAESVPTPIPESTPISAPSTPETLMVLVSKSIGSVGLRLRDKPDVNSITLSILPAGAVLTVLEPADQALPKIGQVNQWLNVCDESNTQGYVAAWYVELKHIPLSTPTHQTKAVPAVVTVIVSSQASTGLRLRDRPSDHGNILEVLMPGTPLTILEPVAIAQAKIGIVNQWLNVRLPGGMTGYVAAWFVTK